MDPTPSETAIIGVHFIEDVVGESGKVRSFFHEGSTCRWRDPGGQ